MTFIQSCDICGAKIEIEDSDDLEPSYDPLAAGEEEDFQDVSLCENCSNNIILTSSKHA
ncbi:hypothetical protein ACFORL_04765 [Legionella dresdenensis]|uniref:Small CPxCG-related zinc finger protein n=1 Tax=Legionella dresdenensis TaxID=450200 RepID=A0ABV8CDZ9_9GAMM